MPDATWQHSVPCEYYGIAKSPPLALHSLSDLLCIACCVPCRPDYFVAENALTVVAKGLKLQGAAAQKRLAGMLDASVKQWKQSSGNSTKAVHGPPAHSRGASVVVVSLVWHKAQIDCSMGSQTHSYQVCIARHIAVVANAWNYRFLVFPCGICCPSACMCFSRLHISGSYALHNNSSIFGGAHVVGFGIGIAANDYCQQDFVPPAAN